MNTITLITWLFVLINYGRGQSDDDTAAILDIFTSPSTPTSSFLDGYEEVTKKNDGGFGAITRCGQGTDVGKHLCVQYYNCDGQTKTIITSGSNDGYGIIDIRYV